MKLQRLVLAISFAALPAVAQWQSIGVLDSFAVQQGGILCYSGSDRLSIEFLSNDLVRVRLGVQGVFDPAPSPAVVKHEWPRVSTTISQTERYVEVRTQEGSIRVSRRPIRAAFLDNNGRVLNEDDAGRGMAWDGRAVRVWKSMPIDENYYGFGEKAGRLNKKFTHISMWNSDIPAYRADTDPLYESIPLFYGIRSGRAYGIFLDNSYFSSFDMGKESPARYSFGAEGGEMQYYFFFGPTPKRVLERFTELTGRMPIPPLWALGYQQCRWSYAPERRVREIAGNFRGRRIPADVIYLDIDYMEGYRIFTWNKERFPDPKGMIGDLAKQGFKIVVIVDPGIKEDSTYRAFQTGLAGNHFLKYPDGRLYIGKVWPGECAFPDFSSSAARSWWGEQFKLLVDAGVRGWWNDMNEPSVFDVPTKTVDLEVIHNNEGLFTNHAKNHNTYGMQMTQATYEGVKKLLPGERPFVLTRASFAGGQRYSAAWTGDNIASWEHLQMAVPMCLNLSISGQPFVGTDVGGFMGYPSGELFARWLQLGVFMPLMRAHSVINEKNKEPWEYGPEFEKINRETIELRYRLLPYIYATMAEASRSGIPPMRPLVFDYPLDRKFEGNDTEFMFGEDLLIAPVLWEGQISREVRLPEGGWYDYWTGEKFTGGTHVTVAAPLQRIPILVKAGAIIPAQPVVQYVGERVTDPLTLNFYPSESSSRMLYEDDGRSFAYEKGEYLLRKVERKSGGKGSKTVVISAVEGRYRLPVRVLELRLLETERRPLVVRAGGRTLGESAMKEGWSYDEKERVLTVKVQDSGNMTISVE